MLAVCRKSAVDEFKVSRELQKSCVGRRTTGIIERGVFASYFKYPRITAFITETRGVGPHPCTIKTLQDVPASNTLNYHE